MYVFEHALLNLGKNKGRNILMCLILFAVITSAFIGVAIYNASDAITRQARIDFDNMVRIRPQARQIGGAATAEGNPEVPQITIEDINHFANSAYLTGATITQGSGGIRGLSIDATFYLLSSDLLPAFEAEMREKGLPDDWVVYRDEAGFRRMLAPIESLSDVALTFLLIVLVFGAAIMVLLSAIAIRERKYEIGVLRAMGMKKKKVALCLWTETIVITGTCFILGMITGTILAQPVSNALWTGDGRVSISLGIITVLQILGVSILLASLAGAVSVSRITKYEPIKILMERG